MDPRNEEEEYGNYDDEGYGNYDNDDELDEQEIEKMKQIKTVCMLYDLNNYCLR